MKAFLEWEVLLPTTPLELPRANVTTPWPQVYYVVNAQANSRLTKPQRKVLGKDAGGAYH